MSTDNQQAAADVKATARSMRAVIAMADQLEAIGSIDQAASEAQQRLDKAVADEATAQGQLLDAKQQLADTAALIDAAKAEAAHLVEAARVSAADIIADAQTQGQAAIETAQQRASTIDASIADKQTALNTVLSDIDTAQHQLDTLNGKIADARTSIANMLK